MTGHLRWRDRRSRLKLNYPAHNYIDPAISRVQIVTFRFVSNAHFISFDQRRQITSQGTYENDIRLFFDELKIKNSNTRKTEINKQCSC